jgi:lipopolysaccharide biosynthesis regulator YciM
MRLNLILLVLLVVLGIGISILLIPREKDVALLKLRSDASDEAREVLLEQYDRGDRSVAVIASLAEIAVSEGEIPTAIQLLEDYVAANPKDTAARRRLAEYYRFDQRRDDYVAMLADVVDRGGTQPERRLLADLYRLRGDYELLLFALGDLIERGQAKERDYREAVQLAAALNKLDQSLAVTEGLWRSFPESFGSGTVKLYVMVAEASGKSELAEQTIARLASGENGPAAIVPVIQEISDRNQAHLGLRLLRQFEGDLHRTPALLVAWARMQQSLDQELVALERLRSLEATGDLPELAVPVLLDLALLSADVELIARVMAERDLGALGDLRLRAAMDLAVYHRSSSLLRQFLAQVRPSFRSWEPALMAEVHIALGQMDEARIETARARQETDRRLDQMLRLARAEIKLGQEEEAALSLDRIAGAADLDEGAMRALATLYVETELTRQGLIAFEKLRQDRPSLAADSGWARLAAAEGRDTELRAWMNTRTGLDEDLLTDIVYLSAPARAPRSALEAARRLFENHPGRESRRLYGEALVATGRTNEAIETLKPLLPGDGEEAESWVAALTSAGRTSEALAFLKSRAATGALETRLADDLIYLALEAGESEFAYREIARQPVGRMEAEAIAAVVARASADGRFDLIDQVVSDAGPDFMRARPVLAARIELARGNPADARIWAERALSRADLRNAEVISLAGVFSALDQPGRSLELLRKLASDPDTPAFALADMGAKYLTLGNAAEGLAMFRELTGRRDEAAVAEAWARLETVAGDPDAVAEWLTGRSVSAQALTDIYYMASESGAAQLALMTSEMLLEQHPGPAGLQIRADALLAAGRPEAALPLLEQLLPGGENLAETYAGTLVALGRTSDAMVFLEGRRGADGGLPLRLADDYVGLALSIQPRGPAYDEAVGQDVTRFDDGLIAALVENATNDRRFDVVDHVVNRLGGGFLEDRPVLAARIALARGDLAGAALHAARAYERIDLNARDRLDLAAVFGALDEGDRAFSLLEPLAGDPETPAAALADLGNQYLSLGRAEDGLNTFRQLVNSRPEPLVLEAWARLEATSGEADAVGRWLTTLNAPSRQLLTDLYYMARERPADQLALQVSDRLATAYPGPESASIRADMLLASGQPAAALPMVEQLLPGNDGIAELYVAALTAAAQPGKALQFLIERAEGAAQPLALADDLIGLAFGEGRGEIAYAEAERQDLQQLDETVLASLAENAANDRRFDLFDRIVAELGPVFLEQRPVLAAQLAMARDRNVEARAWADKALAEGRLDNARIIALASVFSGLGEQATALGLLEDVAQDPATPLFALADLGSAYLSLGRAGDGLDLFRRLRNSRPHPRILEAWARLETAAGDPDAVLSWLNSEGNPSAQALQDVHYLAAGRRADKLAFLAGQRFHEAYPGPDSRRIHATSLVAVGRAEDALPILEELLPGDDEVAEAYVGALSVTDRKAEALTFLRARANSDALPLRIADDYMALAIELDQAELAYAEARLHDMARFDDDTIASIAENAAEDGDLELVDQIVQQTGPAFWAKFPIMAARIEIARGNEALARDWAAKGLAQDNLDNRRLLQLAKVYSDLNETETSLGILESLAADPDTPAFAMGDLASQYLQLGKAKRGLPVMRDLIDRRQEPLVLEGWARLETMAGEPGRVLAWLANASEPSRQALTDIYFIATERQAKALSLETSRRLIDGFPGREASLIRGQALIVAGRGKEAIPLLRPLLPGTREVRAAYVAALGQGGNATDLKAFAEQALSDPALDPEIRSTLLFALLEAGAGDVALPMLRDLARRDPKNWEAAYLDALRQAGADGERADLIEAKLKAKPTKARRDALLFELLEVGGPKRALPWLKQAAEADPTGTWPPTYETALSDLGLRQELINWLEWRGQLPGLKDKPRREVGFRLLDLNAKLSAEKLFLRLAANARPTSPDVQQLLYLWGPKPPARGLDWLVARASASPRRDRAGWLKLLADVRAYEQVVAFGASPLPSGARDTRLQPLVTALIETGRKKEVATLLAPLIPVTDDPDDLLNLADWAEQAEQARTAVAAYERAMGRIGEDAEKLLKAGRAFTFGGRAELAVETLERYFRAEGSKEEIDHRPWYYYGQSLSQMGRQPEARSAYRQMLDVMDRNGAEDFESRRMMATGYESIGDGERAVGIYEGLLAERPRDRSLVADFASLLIELRRYDEAELLLSQN